MLTSEIPDYFDVVNVEQVTTLIDIRAQRKISGDKYFLLLLHHGTV